ncbi:MAG TPA: hypothetical protein PKL14_01185 [Holophaga sp.]|nr:hypothetical protein [Holophaga sp.]
MDTLDSFHAVAMNILKHAGRRARAAAILERWGTTWQGPTRVLDFTHSNHGACLHFNQFIGSMWVHVFTFHATRKEGVFMKGPDTDRGRKSHKLRANRLDTSTLDALFEVWSAHPEARPAGNALEFYLDEVPDETWEVCLQEALACLAPAVGALPPRER